MTRTKRSKFYSFTQAWPSAHMGKFWRRQLHKAERAYAKGYGRMKSIAHYASEVNWKCW
jgi:hypothetical protein